MTHISKLLSPNFTTDEFIRGSGYPNWHDVPLEYRLNVCRLVSTVLQPLRDQVGPVRLLSGGGLRTEQKNEAVGGSPNSKHKVGQAADIWCGKHSPSAIFDLLDEWQREGKIPMGGLGCYDGAYRIEQGKHTFVHVDIRGELARWETKGGSRNPGWHA